MPVVQTSFLIYSQSFYFFLLYGVEILSARGVYLCDDRGIAKTILIRFWSEQVFKAISRRTHIFISANLTKRPLSHHWRRLVYVCVAR